LVSSGGHTSEALTLLSSIDFERYTPRVYVVSEGDSLSIQKVQDLEVTKVHTFQQNQYAILTVPRARKVHQSLTTTPFTAFLSFLKCFYYVTLLPNWSSVPKSKPFADVLVVNGPGTCFILCMAVLVNRVLALPSPRIIYIESFARVKSLSISGKLLQLIVDRQALQSHLTQRASVTHLWNASRFIVQWPTLLDSGGRREYRGWLV
ncbi:oligosaccharide biosynthesis protein Alg14 like protein, partial [Marasmius fiardii PR-910]